MFSDKRQKPLNNWYKFTTGSLSPKTHTQTYQVKTEIRFGIDHDYQGKNIRINEDTSMYIMVLKTQPYPPGESGIIHCTPILFDDNIIH